MVVGNIDVLFSPLHCIWSWGGRAFGSGCQIHLCYKGCFFLPLTTWTKRGPCIYRFCFHILFCIVRLRLGQRIPAHGPLFGHDIVFFCNLPLLENYMGFSLFSLFDKCT